MPWWLQATLSGQRTRYDIRAEHGNAKAFNSLSNIAIVLDPLCHHVNCSLPPLWSTLDTTTFSFTSCPALHLREEYKMARQVLSRSLVLHPQHTRSSTLSSATRSTSTQHKPTQSNNPTTDPSTLHIMWICCRDGTSNPAGAACRRCGHRPCGSCDSINGFRSIRNFFKKLVN